MCRSVVQVSPETQKFTKTKLTESLFYNLKIRQKKVIHSYLCVLGNIPLKSRGFPLFPSFESKLKAPGQMKYKCIKFTYSF